MSHRNDRILPVTELARVEGDDAMYTRASRSFAEDRGPVVVIGVGNEFRRDDGAGPAVVASLRGRVPPWVALAVADGEPARLVEAWTGVALAVVVDAVRVCGSAASRPGTVHRLVVDRPRGAAAPAGSSHGLGLDDAIALSLALGRMPGRLIVHAIEAADLAQGAGLTPPVAAAVDAVAAAVLADIGRGSGGAAP
ncbi:MAG TPA: hydrogenase maturation protease [Streptosporangiaceae bacterium]|jgi:hydrogenase maturation protease|nr:hydrogenase maturation protease [Streptosporangiaceae bacterium]